jgi:hypothetical protein
MSHVKIHRKAFLASTLAAGLGYLGLAKTAQAGEGRSANGQGLDPSPAERVLREPRAVPRREG